MNHRVEILRGRLKKVVGRARLTRGERAGDEREAALGLLQCTAGLLQQERGIVTWKLERARRRLATQARG
jgi:hypothetical protein